MASAFDYQNDGDPAPHADFLLSLDDSELIKLRAALDVEMKRRKIAVSVGAMAEELAIQFFNRTSGCPNLLASPIGTANVDALSRKGERYSIKGICNAKKTGTIYPDADDSKKQLFEYLLIVKMTRDWSLEAIYEFNWQTFCESRSWDKRMNAWYIGASNKTLAKARIYLPSSGT
ncbi:hypothetical protein GOA97_00125 [Sinorhizobium meliloti]|nr:hypothetical protein [Sinorhizobium meliloti]MDW9912878.1 hypothetical protein [Sinorhizobium meliloti]MDW9943980.1 hypothetical protein [Sinorhizobium meliloti]